MAELSDLGDHLGYWMRAVSNAVSHAFGRKLEAAGITVAEWAFLRVLYRMGPAAPSQLAKEMGMTRGAISKLADRLAEKRLIERADDPRDGRAQRLALTVAGREKVPILAALADANDEHAFGALSAADRADLRRILETLANGLGREIPID